ncbi:probable cyclin-dependent serine/threonine-protein kinase DDB_G0292550 [Colias croceus]|uniref:probable cyclin-dependent serine/threonine-protein kinase DDB_G0292550 n=1 Tax=Colias crocea TaxID=72248 RepID=UPI001E27A5E1|nr:probable cyclin-dependent serine/threonine-protein kinase DDB_G0292550 [Colias croceus]
MSLCNTFRLFALSLAIVLSLIDTPADTFTISRQGDFHDAIEDLDQEESIRLEVRDDFTRPNDNADPSRLLVSETETKEVLTIPATTAHDQTSENSFGTTKLLELATDETSTAQEKVSDSTEIKTNESTENIGAFTTVSTINDDHINKSIYEKYGHISQNVTLSQEQTTPSWKKYTTISRKPISNHKMSENRSEEMITDETGSPLQDSKQGDIPSLNQIKSFLSFFKSDAQNDTISSKEVTDQSAIDNLGQTQQNTPPSTDKETPATVESKRGGFLDFSLKSLFEDNDDKKDSSQELNTQRPKNRKLSWRIGSRYRSKEDSSGEKQGRLRFRFRNDDDKNNNDRKKDKNEIKTIQESQEEINTKNKDTDYKEETNKNSNNNNEKNNDERQKESSADSKSKNKSKEQRTEENINSDVKEKSRDRNGSKTDQQILKEWQEFDQKQGRKDNIKIKESIEVVFDDNKNNDKDSKNKEYLQSLQMDSKDTSRESNKKENSMIENIKPYREEKEQVLNIWKIDSKEDYDRYRSRQGNEKGISKGRDNDRRSDNKGEYRNRENQSSEKAVNEKNEDRYLSRTRNEKERDNDRRNEKSERYKEERNHNNKNSEKIINEKDESRSDNNDRRKENSRIEDRDKNIRNERPDKYNEERYRDNKSTEKIMNDKDGDRSRSRLRNKDEESNSNNRRKENSRDRDNNRRNENSRDRDNNRRNENSKEIIRDNKSSERIMNEKDESRSRSRSRNEEEASNSNNRRKESSRNEDRDNNRRSERPEKKKDENRSQSRSRDDEESTGTYRRNENSRSRENERIPSQSRNDNEKENYNRKFESTDKIDKKLQEYNIGKSNTERNRGDVIRQKGDTIKTVEINKSTLKIDVDTVNKIPPQTTIQEEFNNKSNQDEGSEFKQYKQAPMLDEYSKKFLSTIEEEDESETQGPTVIENENVTSKTKQTEQQNIVAVKYPSDFKLNDMETTQNLEPNEPYKLTSISIPNSNEEIKDKENDGVYLTTQNDSKSKISSTPDYKIRDYSRIVFKDDKDEERKEGNKYEKQTTFQPYPTLSEERTPENGEYGNKQINVKQTGTFIQMNEDDIREEFLKEDRINNYEENRERYQGDPVETTTMPQSTIPVKIYEVSKPVVKDTSDEKLSVKPLSILEKLKTTILYPVSPNYKPPKKIEVQPPKTFVRDPDDNSWRNESLSSLGIVFNPKNSSKPFTQVLKNKTETEWNNLLERSNKNETPDLRERLEKIAEIRKTKKKKTDAFGNVYYNDYEDGNSKENVLSNENYSSVSTESYRTSTTKLITEITTTTPRPTTTISTQATTTKTTQAPTTVQAQIDTTTTKPKATTEKTKKVFNVAEYYDSSDEDDADYLSLAKLDLKKYTVPIQSTTEVNTPPPWPVTNNRYVHNKHDDRQPTLQYFPPLTTQKATFKNKGYDDYNHKMNAYTDAAPPTNVLPVSYPKKTTSLPKARKENMFTPTLKSTFRNSFTTKPFQYEKDVYITPAPEINAGKDAYTFVTDDGSFNKASDVIKNYRDFLNAVAKDHEEDKNVDYIQYTKIPTQGVTLNDAFMPQTKTKPDIPENYDYDTDYKKDVLQRFVHNFNENSERFKSNLPLLYNNSIIHSELHGEHGRDVASSRAYLSRLLTRPAGDCENNSTVELSPAYELHYYVPEQEEKEELDPKSVTLPYQYQL